MGVVVGAGTDAHRVASYNPFTALQWLLDGKTVGGVAMRGPEEIPSRIDALRFYTLGSAWFSFDDDERGSLEVGKLADLAVLSDDYMTCPVEKIGEPRVGADDGGREGRLFAPVCSTISTAHADRIDQTPDFPGRRGPMDLQLGNKVAIVTGASKGIGRAIAQTLAQEGMRLAVVARSRRSSTSLRRRLGDACLVQAVDLTNADAPAIVAATMARYRPDRSPRQQRGIDQARRLPHALRGGLGRWLRAEVLWRDAIEPRRVAASAGVVRAIVNIVGIGGRTGQAEFAIGGAVNAALLNLTKVLADRGVKDGVRVNAINPGGHRDRSIADAAQDVCRRTSHRSEGRRARWRGRSVWRDSASPRKSRGSSPSWRRRRRRSVRDRSSMRTVARRGRSESFIVLDRLTENLVRAERSTVNGCTCRRPSG